MMSGIEKEGIDLGIEDGNNISEVLSVCVKHKLHGVSKTSQVFLYLEHLLSSTCLTNG